MKFNISKIIVFLFLLTLRVNAFATVYTLGTDDFIIDVPSPTITYSIGFTERGEISTPAANKGYLYLKTDKKLYLKDDAGLETIVSVSTAGIAASIAALETSTSTLEGYIFDLWTSTSNLEGRVDALEISTSTLEAAIALNTTHRSSDGSDHTYIDQDLTVSGTPTHSSMTVIYGMSAGSGTFTGGLDVTGTMTSSGTVKVYTDLENNEIIQIIHENTIGKEDVPLKFIDDNRMGSTANEVGEATWVIDAEGKYALYIKDGDSRFDTKAHFKINVTVGPNNFLIFESDAHLERMYCVNNIFQFVTPATHAKNHDHSAQTNPTFYIHSEQDPDIDNTQWYSMTYSSDSDRAEFDTGGGDFCFKKNIVPDGTSTNIGTGTDYFNELHISSIHYHSIPEYIADESISKDIVKIIPDDKSTYPASIYRPAGNDRVWTTAMSTSTKLISTDKRIFKKLHDLPRKCIVKKYDVETSTFTEVEMLLEDVSIEEQENIIRILPLRMKVEITQKASDSISLEGLISLLLRHNQELEQRATTLQNQVIFLNSRLDILEDKWK